MNSNPISSGLDRALCINDSLYILVRERDFAIALRKIMGLWCYALGAQWCYVGRWERDGYHVLQSYAGLGEDPMFNPDQRVEYFKTFNESVDSHGSNDFVSIVDFQQHPVFVDFLRTSANPQIVRQARSCFSHIIRCNGRPWGTLVMHFRDRRELTRDEVVFFKSAVHGIELSLVRKGYEDKLAEEQARELAVEKDRAAKQHNINESLEVLLGETDLKTALGRIMAMWCEALGAQWCYLGKTEGDRFLPLYGHAVEAGTEFYDLNSSNAYASSGVTIFGGHEEDGNYLAIPDFHASSMSCLYGPALVNPELIRNVSSCYSHLVHRDGKRWGMLVLMFRNRHVLTQDEIGFFKASVKGIELAFDRSRQLTELKGERDRALAAEKAKSLFFSTVSHDIRTPLNAIVGCAELLEAGTADEEERNRYVSTIRSSGKMLARLVNDILDLSKLESGKLEVINEPTDIPIIAKEVFEAVSQAYVSKGLISRSDIAPMPRVSIDPQRTRQILYNLLSNAYKYTDSGSVQLRTAWHDGTLVLSVSDTGKGISKDNLKNILQPFTQVVDRNHRDGTGLGLSICQHLAHLMGGELRIESVLGQGSIFTVEISSVKTVATELAVADAGAEVCSEVRPCGQDHPPAVRALRVLAVDDSTVNLMVVKAMLVRVGVREVVTAPNGQKALDILCRDPAFDVVLTDLWMPELDGEGLIRAIRENPAMAQLPVYLVTADVEAVATCREKGFTGVLLKPITQACVRELLTEQTGDRRE